MTASTATPSSETPALEPIYHSELVALLIAAGSKSVRCRARGVIGFWNLYVETDEQVRILTSTRSKSPRRFAKMQTMVDYLRDLGITQFTVHLTHVPTPAPRTRPDRSKALKQMWGTADKARPDTVVREG